MIITFTIHFVVGNENCFYSNELLAQHMTWQFIWWQIGGILVARMS